MKINTISHFNNDLPSLPDGLIVAWDITGSWIIRARLVFHLIGKLLIMLHPLCAGSRLYIVNQGPQA